MSDYEGSPDLDKETLNNEIDALFIKTQMNQEEEEEYDMYIPLSVQLESNRWNLLVPSKSTVLTNEKMSDPNEPVVFPQSRVRKIMKMDPSVKIISKQAVALMSKATNLFIDLFAEKTHQLVINRGEKQVKGSTILQICKENQEFQFLLDDLLLEEMDSKRVKTKQTHRSKEPSEEKRAIVKNSISSFFEKT